MYNMQPAESADRVLSCPETNRHLMTLPRIEIGSFSGCLLQVKALNGLITEVTGIKPLSFWQPTEASNGNGNGSHGNGSNGRGKKGGIALNRPNKKKYRKGLPWQRYNGFGHKVRQFCVK